MASGSGYSPDGRYQMLVMGDQQIKIQWSWTDQATGALRTGWYDDDADFAHAKPVTVPKRGTFTVNIVVPAG